MSLFTVMKQWCVCHAASLSQVRHSLLQRVHKQTLVVEASVVEAGTRLSHVLQQTHVSACRHAGT